jgi:sensor histidine kinase YesM
MKKILNKIITIGFLFILLVFPSCTSKYNIKVNKNDVFECQKLYEQTLFEVKDYKVYEIKDYILILQKRIDDLKNVIQCQQKYIKIFLNEK